MARLGHISFFGIALLNLAFAMTSPTGPLAALASPLFLAGAVLMPTVCFLSVWKKPFRHLFFAPVLALLGASLLTLGGL